MPDTNLCLAATFHVWPAMLGEWAGIVKEIARFTRFMSVRVKRSALKQVRVGMGARWWPRFD
jgi:hypothetical protein